MLLRSWYLQTLEDEGASYSPESRRGTKKRQKAMYEADGQRTHLIYIHVKVLRSWSKIKNLEVKY